MNASPEHNDKKPPSDSPQTPGAAQSSHGSGSSRPWFGSNLLIIIYSALLIVVFCIIGFAPYTETFVDAVRNMFQRASLRATPVETPGAETESTSAGLDAAPACEIVWVEHKPDDLGKKSRADVWEENVSDRVKASGMTPREFYKLVAEHNPQLIRDEYEFKKGKTYLLPECQ